MLDEDVGQAHAVVAQVWKLGNDFVGDEVEAA
jgi:hypothetical protein